MHSEMSHLLMPVWQVDFATQQQMENRPYDETIATLHKYKGRWQYGSALGATSSFIPHMDLACKDIPFDQKYWETILLPKLTTFYKDCIVLRLLVQFMYLVFQCAIYNY